MNAPARVTTTEPFPFSLFWDALNLHLAGQGHPPLARETVEPLWRQATNVAELHARSAQVQP